MSQLKVRFNGSSNTWISPALSHSINQRFNIEIPESNNEYLIFTGRDEWTEVIEAIASTHPQATTEILSS
jgi:hypothetical protein